MSKGFFKSKTGKLLLKIVCTVVMIWALGDGLLTWYASDSYEASAEAESYLKSTDTVEVSALSNGKLFDGQGKDTAMIFYPGAKVEYTAYAPLMMELAEAGVDCFLIEMPYNMAVFGVNAAEDIMKAYTYEKWYIAGHSLGGSMAASYASGHMESLEGIVFFASYPVSSLAGEDFKVISIYGSEDGVLNMENYAKSMQYMPEDFTELCIEGGNHAYFGLYGEQDGDGTAMITGKEQRKQTLTCIMKAIAE